MKETTERDDFKVKFESDIKINLTICIVISLFIFGGIITALCSIFIFLVLLVKGNITGRSVFAFVIVFITSLFFLFFLPYFGKKLDSLFNLYF